MRYAKVEHPDFSRLLDHLRRSVRHFVLFEAAYLSGYTRRDLAKKVGITERSLRRRLNFVRKAITNSIDELDRSEYVDDPDLKRDYFK
jgi:DNA-directed RNA polymerase specialized sigma24 family protein